MIGSHEFGIYSLAIA